MLRRERRNTFKLELLVRPVQSVSPMEKIPGSNTPMISPAYASSTIFRSCAIICCGWDRRIFLPPCTCVDFHAGLKFAGTDTHKCDTVAVRLVHIRLNLEDKRGEISVRTDRSCRYVVLRGSGEVVIFRKCSRNVSTPKFVSAEPKNTGDNFPRLTQLHDPAHRLRRPEARYHPSAARW